MACGELVVIAAQYDESRMRLVFNGQLVNNRRERWYPKPHLDGAGLPCVVGERTEIK
jgi:hypothetical protein